jgi:hypothetical protein
MEIDIFKFECQAPSIQLCSGVMGRADRGGLQVKPAARTGLTALARRAILKATSSGETCMSDPKTPEAAPEKPEEKPAEEVHQAKRGVKDAGHIVSSAAGEKLDGRIADITDGDR